MCKHPHIFHYWMRTFYVLIKINGIFQPTSKLLDVSCISFHQDLLKVKVVSVLIYPFLNSIVLSKKAQLFILYNF